MKGTFILTGYRENTKTNEKTGKEVTYRNLSLASPDGSTLAASLNEVAVAPNIERDFGKRVECDFRLLGGQARDTGAPTIRMIVDSFEVEHVATAPGGALAEAA